MPSPAVSQPAFHDKTLIRRYAALVALSVTEWGCPRHEGPSDDSVGRGLLSRLSSHKLWSRIPKVRSTKIRPAT